MASDLVFNYVVAALAISVCAFIGLIAFVWFSGYGKPIVRRVKQRWLYKNGKYVNVIFIRNNHVSDELFIAKESDGSFKINDERYIVNPRCTFTFQGIPTQINKEGIVEPYDLFTDDMAEKMSTAEIEKVIMNNEVGDLV